MPRRPRGRPRGRRRGRSCSCPGHLPAALFVALVALLAAGAFASLAVQGVAGAQEQDGGGAAPSGDGAGPSGGSGADPSGGGGARSYLPDAEVKGLPASRYRVIIAGEDCKLDVSDNPILSGGTSLIPGVGGIVDAITPDVTAPTALCPSAFAKDGLGKATAGMWAAGTTVVSVLTDGIEALLSFDIANLLAPVVDDASHRIDDKVVGPLNLRSFALAAAGIFVGFLFLTGRLGRAVGELARVLLALSLAGLIMSNVTGFYRTMSEIGREASSAGLSVAGEDNARRPLDSIREALIWDQWQGQQFGSTLPPECADAAHAALRDDKSVIKAVDAAGCHDEAKRATESSWGRFFAAAAYFALATFMAWQLVKLALGMALGQAALALSMMFAPVACALAPFRGARVAFGAWLGTIARFLVGMVFAALLLAVTVLAILPILSAPWSPFFRLATAAGVVWAISRLSRTWLQGLERSAHRGTSSAVVGGVAVGAGIGAGAVAAQGIVSSSHQRADLVAANAKNRTVRTVGKAGGKATEVGQKAAQATPVAKTIQERREARHTVAQDDHRQRVLAEADARRERKERREARVFGKPPSNGAQARPAHRHRPHETEKRAERPADRSVERPVDRPADRLSERPVETSVAQPVEKKAEQVEA